MKRIGRVVMRFLEWFLQAVQEPQQWRIAQEAGPQQKNQVDCGVFVCATALCLTRHHSPLYQPDNSMIRMRQTIAAVLMKPGFVEEFRWGEAFL
jgi:Ulp1 family protease